MSVEAGVQQGVAWHPSSLHVTLLHSQHVKVQVLQCVRLLGLERCIFFWADTAPGGWSAAFFYGWKNGALQPPGAFMALLCTKCDIFALTLLIIF